MTATSTARAEASRQNGRKSIGPKSDEGKIRVRLNAIKHGLSAKTFVLPGEDAAKLDARVAAWKQDVQPQTTMEDYLVERAAHVSWQLDRADRTIAARLTGLIADAPLNQAVEEADQVADLAFRLFWHPRGPIALYPQFPQLPVTPQTSRPETVENALNPARIVNRLEALPTGCQWLLDRWAELRKLLDDGLKWQPPDRLRTIRLLGRQPTDALDDERVLSIYLACNAMDPGGPPSFGDVVHEMDDAELKAFAERIAGRRARERQPAGPAAGQAALRAIIEQAVTRLQALVAGHRERQALSLPAGLDGQAFDDSVEGERMRRYQQTHSRALNSTIQTLFKVRKELGARTEEPAVNAGVPGVEVPVGDAPALATTEPWTGGCDRIGGRGDAMEPFAEGDVGASGLSSGLASLGFDRSHAGVRESVNAKDGVEAGSAGPPLDVSASGMAAPSDRLAALAEIPAAQSDEPSDKTNPRPADEPSDKTNPRPADEPSDKTNPRPAEHPSIGEPVAEPKGLRVGTLSGLERGISAAGGSIDPVRSAEARPRPSGPLPPMILQLLKALARQQAPTHEALSVPGTDPGANAAGANPAGEVVTGSGRECYV